MKRIPATATAFALLALTATARPAQAAWPHDPNNGNVAVCTVAGDQQDLNCTPDGSGGTIVTWTDQRSGTSFDVYAQRISAAGVPLWTASGVALCTAANDQYLPTIDSDGAGGAIVTWYDFRGGASTDIYAQRISAAGVPQWTANGVALCAAVNNQYTPTIVPDGAGGAIVTWLDGRSGTSGDIYAQRISAAGVAQWTANGVALCTAAGVPQWTADGVALCTAAGQQYYPRIVADGAGGAIVTWYDNRSGAFDIYAQRISAAGVPQWSGNGVALCTATSNQQSPTIAPDGAGGAIVTWIDGRSLSEFHLYAQRVSAAGVSLWTPDGVALCTAVNSQLEPAIVSDGAGGAIVTWDDGRSGSNEDIYAQRIGATGTTLWTWNGVAVSTAVNNQLYPTIAADGGGGAIVTWRDSRGGSDADIYSQRIEPLGQLGNPEPAIVNVKDYPNDQGGKVRIKWDASYLDPAPYNLIGNYYVWRQAPPFAALAALHAGSARLLGEDESPAEVRGGTYRITQSSSGPYYWEFVGSQIAQGFPGYSYVTNTDSDSVGAGNPPTRFMIEAVSSYYSVPTAHWESAPDSGYSVDNLPPVIPAPFTGQYAAGTALLHWSRNLEADLAGYRLYRGTSLAFTPGPGNQVAAPPDTGYADPAGAPYTYKLTAIDAHGNESPAAALTPSGTLDVGDTQPLSLSLAAPSPNPARGASSVDYTLSRAGRVRLSVYDAAGRRLQVVRQGELAAGRHREHFALRDDSGRDLPSGLYLVRLEAEGRVLTRRLAAIR